MTDDTWPAYAQEIRNLLARVTYAMDSAPDVGELVALMTEDVEFVFAANPAAGVAVSELSGAAAIRAWAESRRIAEAQGPGSGKRHVVSNEIIEPVGPSTVRVTNSFAFYSDVDGSPKLRALGYYDNEFRRTEDGWRLAKRTVRPS